MADDKCLGDGNKKWKSELRPDGNTKFDPDGKIKIFKESNKLKGKHEDSGNDLEDLACDGKKISFSRLGKKGGKTIRVFYEDGVISGPSGGKFKIKGRYTEKVIGVPAVPSDKSAHGRSKTKDEAGPPDPPDGDTGDWKAERPTAGG